MKKLHHFIKRKEHIYLVASSLLLIFSLVFFLFMRYLRSSLHIRLIHSPTASYTNTHSDIRTDFFNPQNPRHLYTLADSKSNGELRFYLDASTPLQEIIRTQPSSNEVKISNIDKNTDLVYHILEDGGVKEDIVIGSQSTMNGSSNRRYRFHVEAQNLVNTKMNGDQPSFTFESETSKNIFQLLPPFMIDAKGVRSDNVTMTIEKIKKDNEEENDQKKPNGQNLSTNSYMITVIPDPSWLADKSRAYPVTIDPSVVKGTAPVASWNMDEGVGLTAADASGNGNNLTLNGSAPWVRTSSDMTTQTSSIQFDGSNDSLSRAYDSDFDFGTGSFSVSSWFKHTSVVTGTDTLMARYSGSGWKIYMTGSGTMCFGIDDDATFNPDDSACSQPQYGSYADSKWHHLEAVKSTTSSITLYIDGQQVGTDTSIAATGTLNGTTPVLYLGIDSDGGSNPWTGFIDTTNIYNYARDANQIKADNMISPQTQASFGSAGYDILTDELIDYLKMDESAANGCAGGVNDSCDSSGNGNDAAWTNGATNAVGKFGNGVSFDGTNDYLDITGPTSTSQSYTFSSWLKSSAASGVGNYVFDSSAGRLVIAFQSGNTAGKLAWYDGSWHDIANASRDGVFHQVVWVLDAASRKGSIYQDGILLGTDTYTPTNIGGTLRLGNVYDNTTSGFNGTMDDVRIYNRALSSSDVQKLYAWSPPPVGYWNLDDNSGTSPVDISGNNNSLSIVATTAPTITFQAIVTGSASGAPTSVSTARGVTAANNTLYIATVAGKNDTGVISSLSGLGLTWNLVNYQCSGRAFTGAHVYYAYGSPGTSGNVTANFSTPPSNDAVISVARYTNANPDNPIGNFTGANQYGVDSTNCDGGNSSSDDTDVPYVELKTTRYNSYAFGAIAHRLRTLDGTFNNFVEEADFKTNSAGDSAGIAYIDKLMGAPQMVGVGGTISSATDWAIVAGEIFPIDPPDVKWTPGRFGSGVELMDQGYIQRADDADFDFTSTDQFSISFWFKHGPATVKEQILNKSQVGTNGGYQLYMASDGDIVFEIDDDSSWTPDASITSTAATYDDNNWHHIETIKNGTTSMSLYIDGNLITTNSSISSVGSLANDDALNVGIADDETSNPFNGMIDDLKIYRYARSLPQIAEDMNAGHPLGGAPVGAPVAYWMMDEGYGTTINDSSANNLDGTIVNSTWTQSGKYGKALSFDGTGDYVTTAADAYLDTSLAHTYSFWFNASSWTASNKGLVGDWTADDTGTMVYLQTSTSLCAYVNNTEKACTTPPSTGTWHHGALVYSGSTISLYIDGELQSSSPAGTADGGNFQIGAYNSTSVTSFNGSLDEVKVYNSALTDDQILAEYNHGKTITFGSSSTASDGKTPDNSSSREYCVPGDTATCNAPVAEYKLDENTGTTTAYDTSGNGRNGTLTSITSSSWVKGKFGSALRLDGASDYVDIGTGPSTVNSISFWVYPETTTEYFVNLTSTTSYIWANAGTVTATGLTSPIIYVNGVRTSTIAANQWSFVTVTSSTNVNASNLDVGRVQDANYLQGKIDEVHLYDYVRTPGQINWEYNKGKPIGWYKMNECSGTAINNSCVNANNTAMGYNGTLTIGAAGANTTVGTCTTSGAWFDGATGKYNSAMDFDGSDDYISISDTSDLRFDGSQDFTLAAWVKRNTSGSVQYVIGKEDADNDGYRLQFDAANTLTCSVNSIDITSAAAISDTNWHHIACVVPRNGNGQVYIDGDPSGNSVAISNTPMATTTALRIASRSYTPTFFFNGLIDEVRIYPYALTPVQLITDMNEHAVGFR